MISAIGGEASWSIPVGADVYDVEGEKLGHVTGADGYDLLVESGLLIVTTLHVPMALVDRYEDGNLHLSVTRDELTKSSESP